MLKKSVPGGKRRRTALSKAWMVCLIVNERWMLGLNNNALDRVKVGKQWWDQDGKEYVSIKA